MKQAEISSDADHNMRRVLAIAFIFLLSCCSCSSEANKIPYRLGNFAPVSASSLTWPKTSSLLSVKSIMTNVSQLWKQCARYLRLCVFIYYTRESVDSILEEAWEAVRDPDRVFGQQIRRVGEHRVVMRRSRKSEALRALVGAGYTARLVWLFGVMLRGIVHCTALPQVFFTADWIWQRCCCCGEVCTSRMVTVYNVRMVWEWFLLEDTLWCGWTASNRV